MRIAPEIDGVTAVMVGDFNPPIYTPAWFALHGLLPEAVAESAELAVAHTEVTQFTADWLSLEVTRDRYQVRTLQAPHIRVHDLILRVFGEHMQHTPLRAFGINRDVHFQVESQVVRDNLGSILAPTEPWGRWGRELEVGGEHGGMRSLTMTQVNLEGRPRGGEINVVNDHFVADGTGLDAGERLMALFEDSFSVSLSRSEELVDQVMSLVLEQES